MKILFGITGSVAVSRVPQIVKALLDDGHEIKIIRTKPSSCFWDKEWNKSLGVEIFTDEDEWVGEKYARDMPIAHIELGKWADIMLIAPLTFNTLGGLANGLADNLLTATMAAWDCRNKAVVVAPAMNTKMWNHPARKMNLKKLRKFYNLVVVGPVKASEDKPLACGDVGFGKIADTEMIAQVFMPKRVTWEYYSPAIPL